MQATGREGSKRAVSPQNDVFDGAANQTLHGTQVRFGYLVHVSILSRHTNVESHSTGFSSDTLVSIGIARRLRESQKLKLYRECPKLELKVRVPKAGAASACAHTMSGRDLFFFETFLFCFVCYSRHNAMPPTTSGMHTNGAQ